MTRLETTLDRLSGLDRLNAAPLAGRMEEVLDTVLDNVRDHAGSASDARRSPAIGASRATVRHLPRDAALLLDILAELHGGVLTVRLPDGASLWLGDDQAGPAVDLHIHDWSVFARVLARGDIGFAEAYLDGQVDSSDLAALLTRLNANRAVLEKAVYGHWRGLLAARLRHLFNANTRAGSKRNILAHYDLGNDFYRLWLDESMTYSAGLFSGDPARSLAAAQDAKYRRILRKLGARPEQIVLEIGCGWGGFAELAAREAGVRVEGVTLSPAQLAYAQERLARAGLDERAHLMLRDYRDIRGQYDHIVSIEMFEAVGERYWPSYFRTVKRALAPEGRALVQSIVIRDDLFARYRRGTDFIQQYVFPGGMLPSPGEFGRRAARAGLAVTDQFSFGPDYARTLALWRERFEAAWPRIAPLGFDERFRRLWRFYLAYCEAGFATGSVDVVQFELRHG
ncbi:cyclopropane-fatty-acyl-phospholipid synthase [Oryzomicrobium terrae]|uniref:Cyclopropane-fatty-acyl-phospholipid synthase n=1 Tax=Oryzomicrobium terrae TaxID=1735038 RepID=A0A5C1E5I5_9RHOO|nr:cyclopropane-fatty-acyl-phospholipid synthase family protein [Oryzomicrobium terrae]QEL64133.1 cyclopropane-fatty-acyl-phospholipid synthase [Oryzomicrobium terrae]